MSDKKEVKPLVEKHRIRARNSFETVSQIVNEYNSSNGWQVTKVIPSPLNLDVYLERSSKQGASSEPKSTSPDVTNKEVSVEKPSAKEEVKVTETTKKPTAPRKVNSKTADGGATTNSTDK